MLYDYLDEFLVVAHCGTLSGAAGTLGVSQPSLGRHLSALETSLGARLLERGPYGVTLTDAGRRALACAEEIAGLEASLVSHFRDPERRLRERVLAVAVSYLDEYVRRLLDKTCERLTEEGYAVRLEVSKLPADEDPARLLADRDVDAAICLRAQAAGAVGNGRFEEDLYRMGAGVIVRAESAPAGPLALENVLDEVFTLGREPGQHALWDELLRICDSRGLPAPAMRAPRRPASSGASQSMRSGDVRLCACDPLHPASPAEGERALPVCDLSFEVVMLGRAEDDVVRRAARIAREIARATGAPRPADQPSMYVVLPKTPMSVGALTFAEQGEYLARVLDEPRVENDLVLPDGTVVDKVYVALRNRLNRIGDGLSGDPVPTSYEAIMRLWSREDAEAYLEMPLLETFTAYDFAESSGRSVEECERILEDLSSRSLVFRQVRGGVPQYFLLAWTYGVWEFMVSDYDKGFLDWGIYGYDLGSASQFPTMRACPIGPETLAEGVPLSPYWDWRSFISRQDLIATAPCQCQLSVEFDACIRDANRNGNRDGGADGGADGDADGGAFEDGGASGRPDEGRGEGGRRRDHTPGPQKGLCITLGDMARYWIDNGNGRQISREECLERATEAIYRRGCVPQAIYTKNPEVVCFCDVSFCHVISAIRSTGGAAPSMQLSSAYRLNVDAQRCTGCGACARKCPMRAISVGEDGTASVGPMCLSCGHCTLVCENGALSLTPKERGAEARLPQDLLEDYRWRSEDRMARGYINDFTQGRIDLWAAM